MSDNLKLAKQNIDAVITNSGGVGSILASDHNAVLTEMLGKVGRYTGLPFLAQDAPNVGGVIPVGLLVWNGNSFNDTNSFTLTISKQTADLNDVSPLLNSINNGATIRFKDFVGRSVLLEYVSHVLTDDGNGNDIYNITVKGKAENLNYAYQPGESEACIIEFYLNALSLPNTPGNEGDVLLHDSGGFGVLAGFNYNGSVEPIAGLRKLTVPSVFETRSLLTETPTETVDFEGGDFVGTGFSTDGNQPWTVDSATQISGLYSARSGAITGNQVSNLYKTVTLSAVDNTIRFGVFTDTELQGDTMDIYINSITTSGTLVFGQVYRISDYQVGDDFTNVGAPSNATGVVFVATGSTPAVWSNSSSLALRKYVDSFSGSNPWKIFDYPVLAGTYEIQWTYRKDPNTNVGADVVRIDLFETAEIFRSSNFQGLNNFSGINVFSGQIEFRDKVLGNFETNSDIIVNGIRFGAGASNVNSNIIVDSAINNGGQLLTNISGTNTVIGANCFGNATDAKGNSGLGTNVMRNITTGQFNVAIGSATLRGLTTGSGVMGIGRTTSDLPFDLTNTFFVNDGDGVRMLTYATASGLEIPLQTNAFIDGGSDFMAITKKYFNDNLAAVSSTPEFSVGNSDTGLAQLVPTGDPALVGTIGYNLLTTLLEANETQEANSAISYKDISDVAQPTYLNETANKFLFPSNLNTFNKTYVSYFIRTVLNIDLSLLSNATTKYYVRLRRVVDDSIIAVDEFTQSDFPAQNGLIVTSEMKTFVSGESDPFVVDGCYLDILNDSNSAGTVTLQDVSVRIFRD